MDENHDERIRKLAGALILLFILGLLAMANWGISWPGLFYKPVIREVYGFHPRHSIRLHYTRKINWLPGPKVLRFQIIDEKRMEELRSRGAEHSEVTQW